MGLENEEIKRCLISECCSDAFIDQVCACNTNQNTREVKRLLFQQRKCLLQEIHDYQHLLDQLDYVIWKLDHCEEA